MAWWVRQQSKGLALLGLVHVYRAGPLIAAAAGTQGSSREAVVVVSGSAVDAGAAWWEQLMLWGQPGGTSAGKAELDSCGGSSTATGVGNPQGSRVGGRGSG